MSKDLSNECNKLMEHDKKCKFLKSIEWGIALYLTIGQQVEAQISSFVEIFSDTSSFTVELSGDVVTSLKTQQFDKQVILFWTSDSSRCIFDTMCVIGVFTFPTVLFDVNRVVTRDYG